MPGWVAASRCAPALRLSVEVPYLTDVACPDFVDTQEGFTLGTGRNVSVCPGVPSAPIR